MHRCLCHPNLPRLSKRFYTTKTQSRHSASARFNEISDKKQRHMAFVDPSGGRGDAMTLAIGHGEGKRCVIDLARAWPAPFNPTEVVAEIASICKDYYCHDDVIGDAYAGAWVEAEFKKHHVKYAKSKLTKNEIYLAALPIFSQGRAELPPQQRLTTELVRLQRRTSRGGKDSIDHPGRAHDDLANACCGALVRVDGVAKISKPRGVIWGFCESGTLAGKITWVSGSGLRQEQAEDVQRPSVPPPPARPGAGSPPADYAARREAEVAAREAELELHKFERFRKPVTPPKN
jgi:hypothetical protein